MWGSIPFTPEKLPHFPPERRPTSNGILPRFAPESLPHFDRNPQELFQKRLIVLQPGEITAVPQQQRLIESALEAVVSLFYVAILVSMTGLDFPAFYAVVPQKSLIALLEFSHFGEVVHRRCHTIGPMQQRYSSQLPQRRLQSFTQTGEAF